MTTLARVLNQEEKWSSGFFFHSGCRWKTETVCCCFSHSDTPLRGEMNASYQSMSKQEWWCHIWQTPPSIVTRFTSCWEKPLLLSHKVQMCWVPQPISASFWKRGILMWSPLVKDTGKSSCIQIIYDLKIIAVFTVIVFSRAICRHNLLQIWCISSIPEES